MTPEEMRARIAEAKANLIRLRRCPQHKFRGPMDPRSPVLTCVNCAGRLPIPEVGAYVQGFVAAGGLASDIWDQLDQSWPSVDGLDDDPVLTH